MEPNVDDHKLIAILSIYSDDAPKGYELLKNYMQQVALQFAGERIEILRKEILKG